MMPEVVQLQEVSRRLQCSPRPPRTPATPKQKVELSGACRHAIHSTVPLLLPARHSEPSQSNTHISLLEETLLTRVTEFAMTHDACDSGKWISVLHSDMRVGCGLLWAMLNFDVLTVRSFIPK